jgi:cell fate regulator YaaT (PSP1 superfamily)
MSKSLTAVNVRFFDQVRPATCSIGDLEVSYGQKVVALSDRGLAIGIVNSSPFYLDKKSESETYQKIIKIASEKDVEDCK